MPHAIRLNRFRTEHGATMLEATFCILFVLFCIGAVIDLGLGLWQYNFLNYTTTRAAREISARLATNSSDCGTLENSVIRPYLLNTAKREMVTAMASGAAAQWRWCMVGVGQDACLGAGQKPAYKSLRMVGSLPLNCYFLCSIVPVNWTVTTTVTSAIDNLQAPTCTEGGPYP